MEKNTSLRRVRPQFNGFSGSSLKLIAMLTMIIDHTGVSIVSKLPGIEDKAGLIYALYWICRLIGRIAFPIFLFLMVQGFEKTRNRWKYVLRLITFFLLSEVPFDLALRSEFFDWQHQNVYLTLLIGFMVIWGFEKSHEHLADVVPTPLVKVVGIIFPTCYFTYRSYKYLTKSSSISINTYLLYGMLAFVSLLFVYSLIKSSLKRFGDRGGLVVCINLTFLAVGMLTADLLHTDYSSTGVLAMVMMYVFRSDYSSEMLAGCTVLTVFSSATELVSFVTVPLIQNYNGKRGLKLKYLFYAIYPVHLLILFLIAHHFGLR